MEQKPPRLMTPFDSLITPPGLYTLKLLLPYTPPSAQHFLAVYIKFAELSYTMEHFRGFPAVSRPLELFSELKAYMSPEERENLEQMETMMNMMEMMQHADAADFMQDFMKGGFEDDERMDGPSDAEEYGSGEAGADPQCSQ